MRRFPLMRVNRQLLCLDDGEAEGLLVIIEWFGWFVELSMARRVRLLD